MASKAAVALTVVMLSIISDTADTSAQTQSAVAATHFRGEASPAATAGLSIKVNVNTVLVNVSVRDRYSNRSISGLEPNDFQVYEDGVLQELQQEAITDVPYSLLLLMDVSGSTYSYLKLMKNAATEFTREISQEDKLALASFNSKVRLRQNFTSDLDATAKAISRLHSAGGTAFYDALMTCVDKYLRNIVGRKAIVVFTDGVDNVLSGNSWEGSRTSFQELCSRLQESDTLIYTIFMNSEGKPLPPPDVSAGETGRGLPTLGRLPFPFPSPFPSTLPSPKQARRRHIKSEDDEREAYHIARNQLAAIAGQTGGRTYSPLRAEELSSVYSKIADDLRVQYVLSYVSSNPSQAGRWRAIRVEVRGHPEAAISARKGYAINQAATTR